MINNNNVIYNKNILYIILIVILSYYIFYYMIKKININNNLKNEINLIFNNKKVKKKYEVQHGNHH